MINLNNLSEELPYLLFKEKYDAAFNAGQKNIEAIAIASFNKEKNEVESRFVNLKIIDFNKFIFFSNYNSPKSLAFNSHDQITALFFWSATNTQIRMKAKIKKTSSEYNQNYFENRSSRKNALAISSNQSQKSSSYEEIVKKYNEVYENNNLKKCPNYWGGFYFIPYYFEFWEGHESRINKRWIFKKIDNDWEKFIIQP